MSKALLLSFLERSRQKTLDLIAVIEKHRDAKSILGWRPGPGRAHLAWQLMHIGATDDRHLYVRMCGGEPHDPELVRRFAGGSVPDDEIPSLEQIRAYLDTPRADLFRHLDGLSRSHLT